MDLNDHVPIYVLADLQSKNILWKLNSDPCFKEDILKKVQ